MTEQRAKQLLREIWVAGRNITPEDSQEIYLEAIKHPRFVKTDYPAELPVDTLLRVAGIDFDWRSIDNWGERANTLLKLTGG